MECGRSMLYSCHRNYTGPLVSTNRRKCLTENIENEGMKRGTQFDTSHFLFLVAFLVNEFLFLNNKNYEM